MVNLGFAVLFLMASFQHLLSPEKFWFLGHLSIAFPYLLLVLLAFLFFWLFIRRRRKYVFISLIPLVIGYAQISTLFSLRHHDFHKAKAEGDIRVLTWNIMSFYGFKPGVKEREMNADRIFALIKEVNPDVICLQEYGQFEDPNLGRSYLEQMDKMGYKFYVLSRDYSRVVYSYSSGLAIFSKHPMVGKERIPYRSSSESLLLADIAVGKDTFRVFTTHLQSYRFSGEELAQVEKIKDKERPSLSQSRSLISKMQRAFRNRAAQVNQAIEAIDSSRYPQIICLDMNDVPTSYAYWNIRGDRTDAFLEKGFGIGRTYMSLLPSLRIDFIFSHPAFTVTQMKIPKNRYSDHLPVVADLHFTK
jgi:endonuclease/exonuclease/phosphatase family metal-dependent hydrolase